MYIESFQQIFDHINWPREKTGFLLVPLSSATNEENKQKKLPNYPKQ